MDRHAERSKEKLRLLQRALEEAVELRQVESDDELLKVTLRQHDKAVERLNTINLERREVQKSLKQLRCEVKEALRQGARLRSSRQQVDDAAAEHRTRAAAQQHQAAIDALRDLQQEAAIIEGALQSSVDFNQQLHAQIRDLEQQHASTLEENANAHRMLGLSGTEPKWKELGMQQRVQSYRKAHERERAEASECLEHVRASCEQQMAEIAEVGADHEAKFQAGMAQLRKRFLALQALVEERHREVNAKLAQQEGEHARWAQVREAQAKAESRRLQDLKQEKLTAGSFKVAQAEQGLVEARECTKRQLGQHAADLRHAYHYKVRMEEARLDEVLRDVQTSVVHARRVALEKQKRKDQVLRDYHSHALSTGAYVRGMDQERRERIWRSHERVGLVAIENQSARRM
mmetsp:Transcript_64515/g.120042  ORF Transcript_64515/g.120042 Transcript_64515/m.120042 type:complete len:404 (-) Transcript_64515:73-1284(-)